MALFRQVLCSFSLRLSSFYGCTRQKGRACDLTCSSCNSPDRSPQFLASATTEAAFDCDPRKTAIKILEQVTKKYII